MVVLFGVADSLEANCVGKARDAIAAVMALKPETAVLADSGERRGLRAPSSVLTPQPVKRRPTASSTAI